MISSATPDDYRRIVEIVISDPGIDSVLVLNVTPPTIYTSLDVLKAISNLPSADEKPIVSAFMADDSFYMEASGMEGAPPVYRFPESAVGALRTLVDYSEGRTRSSLAFRRFDVDRNRIDGTLEHSGLTDQRAYESGAGDRLLPFRQSMELLESYGIRIPRQEIVGDRDGVTGVLGSFNGAVSVKALCSDLLHKTDIDAVELNLRGSEEVNQAAERIEKAVTEHGYTINGYVVQEMVAGGIELIIGTRRDRTFGGVLMVGLGGLFTEVLNDVQVRVLPVTETDCTEMLGALTGYPVVTGRGRGKGAHVSSVIELMGRIAQMAGDLPMLTEIELNPVICLPEPDNCLAVDIVIRTGSID
jgi:acetyltransferase